MLLSLWGSDMGAFMPGANCVNVHPHSDSVREFHPARDRPPLKAQPRYSQGLAGLRQEAWALTGHRAGPAGVQGRDAWSDGHQPSRNGVR